MNVIDRFQLENGLTDKSAEAEAQARETAEEKKKVEKLNQQLQEVNVRKTFLPERAKSIKVSLFISQSKQTELEAEAEATDRKKAELQSMIDLLTMQMEDMRRNLPVCLYIAT